MISLRFGVRMLVLSLCVSAPAALAAEASPDWPNWLGPNHDGKSLDTGLLKEWPDGGPKLLWQADKIGSGYSSVAVSGGTVYTTGDVGGKLTVFAFDMDGKPKWQIQHGQGWRGDPAGSRATPTIDGDSLYLINGAGQIGCFSTADGKPKWQKEMKQFGGQVPGWGYAESVLITGKMAVVTPGGKNCIVALDKATGETIWMSKGFSAGAHYGSCIAVTFENTPLIIAGTGGGLVCVDARTGEKLWSDDWSAGNTANCPTPAYADGYVFWANGYGKGGVCMKLTSAGGKVSAERAWTTDKMDCHHGGYIIEKGCVYGNNGGGWSCLDLKTGARKWGVPGVGKGSLCFADGMLYLFSESNGRLGLGPCTPEGYRTTGQLTVKGSGPSWAHPVVCGGRLYVRYDANLYCFDVKSK